MHIHSTEENLSESSPKSKKRKKNKGNPKVSDEEQKKVENEINKIWKPLKIRNRLWLKDLL